MDAAEVDEGAFDEQPSVLQKLQASRPFTILHKGCTYVAARRQQFRGKFQLA